MMRISARFLLGLGLAGLCALAAPTSAHATLRLTLTVTRANSGTQSEYLETTSGGMIIAGTGFSIPTPPAGMPFVLPFDGFTISGLFANSTLSTRTLQDSPFSVMNTGTDNARLSIMLSDDGVTAPIATGLNLSSGASLNSNSASPTPAAGTITDGGMTTSVGTVSFQSFVGVGLNDTSGIRSTLLTFGPTTTTVSQNSPVVSNFTRPSQPFSITSIATFTLASQGSTTGFSGTSVVSTPEPATLATALAGAPVVGLFFWRRRRAGAGASA